MNSVSDIYPELLLDLYHHPLNKSMLADFDVTHTEFNPLCGESMIIYIKFNLDGIVQAITWQSDGCAISQASASVTTELVKGKHRKDVLALTTVDILEQLGLTNLNPTRLRCALLALATIKKSIH